MKCMLCKKQYVGRAEIDFNIRLNNHRNVVKNYHPKTILTCKNFPEKNQNFIKHAKLIIIDKLTNKKNLKIFCDNAYTKEKTSGSKY